MTLSSVSSNNMVTTAEGGAAGATAVTPVIAISVANNETLATLGTLAGDTMDVGDDLSVTANQAYSVDTTAEGATESGSTGVGISLALAIGTDVAIATTQRSLLVSGRRDRHQRPQHVQHRRQGQGQRGRRRQRRRTCRRIARCRSGRRQQKGCRQQDLRQQPCHLEGRRCGDHRRYRWRVGRGRGRQQGAGGRCGLSIAVQISTARVRGQQPDHRSGRRRGRRRADPAVRKQYRFQGRSRCQHRHGAHRSLRSDRRLGG
ncbi:hypothetical protein LP420_40175 [Massilia sp. B-10]|nr:hypothetical protein LP420_40175 [Massilia sp. B-10]